LLRSDDRPRNRCRKATPYAHVVRRGKARGLRRITTGRIDTTGMSDAVPTAGAGLGRERREPPTARPPCWLATHRPSRFRRKLPSTAPRLPGNQQGPSQDGPLWLWGRLISMTWESPSIYSDSGVPVTVLITVGQDNAPIGSRVHWRVPAGNLPPAVRRTRATAPTIRSRP
jgi:hypothetical protein